MNKYIFVIIFTIRSLSLQSQNYIQNPSFETLDKNGSVAYWKVFGLNFPLGAISEATCGCLCGKKDLLFDRCKLQKNIIDGCASVQLTYISRCNSNGNIEEYPSCASYVTQKLKMPLSIGDTFKISYWVYRTDHYAQYTLEPMKHLGVLLTNREILDKHVKSIIEKDAVTIYPKVTNVNEWQKIETYIVPTCELHYITLGIFKESNWVMSPNISQQFVYFVDNIIIEKINNINIPSSNVFYYCNQTEKYSEDSNHVSKEFTLYFDNNADTPNNPVVIDSLVQEIRQHPQQIYYLSGHTDNVGSSNMDLSQRRVENVRNDLVRRFGFPSFRFITSHFGDRRPLNNNLTATEKAQNRRVIIKSSPIKKANACYRQAILHVKEQKFDSAFNMLFCWVTNEKSSEKILAFFDPQLTPLRTDKRWQTFATLIKQDYKNYSNPKYAFLLDSLYCEDQKYRRLEVFVQDLAGFNEEIDTVLWHYPPISKTQDAQRDKNIFTQLNILLEKYGYPREEEVGKRSAKAAAVILVHTPDTVALKKYLPILEENCKIGNGDWVYYAIMVDRLCLFGNKPQIYGTQFITDPKDDNYLIRYQYESLEKINEARRKIALTPISKEEFNIKVKAK